MIDLFLKLLNERHNELKSKAAHLIKALGSEDLGTKKKAAQETLSAAENLKLVIPSTDVPNWLHSIIHYISGQLGPNWRSSVLLQSLIPTLPSLNEHTWNINDNKSSAIDFDGVFELYRKESRLPELFSEIVKILESIKDSGDVDSLSMIEALAKVISTIKKCSSGSYFSVNGAWAFLTSFLNNYLWVELGKIPVLGSAFEALRKTIDETEAEIEKVNSLVKQDLDKRAKTEIKAIGTANFEFVTYGKSGTLIERSSSSNLETES